MAAFVLERFNWRRVGPTAWRRLPGENTVATFDDRDCGDAEAAEREALARLAVGHPFRCGAALAELTALPEVVFLDWLRDGDIDPPEPDPDGRLPWLAWADLFHIEWTAGQLAHVWEGCNRVRFFRVRLRTAAVLHCVLRVDWSQEVNDTEYNSFFNPEAEGGTPVVLWHDRAAAESDAHDKQRLAAEEVAAAQAANGDETMRFDPTPRLTAADPFDDVRPATPTDCHAITHCEVAEVEAPEPIPPGGLAFLVLRLGWDFSTDPDGSRPFYRGDYHGGWPVAVFADRAAAERDRDHREAEYRATANPFRFAEPDAPDVPAELPVELTRLGVTSSTGRDVDRIRAAAALAGFTLPPFASETALYWSPSFAPPLHEWWDRNAAVLTAEQRDTIWSWFSRLRFFEVREVRVAGQAGARAVRRVYLVRSTNWEPDGGPIRNPHRFLGAFADPERAEEVRAEADRKARTNRTPLPMWRDSAARNRWELFSSWSKDEMRRHFRAHGLIGEAEPAYFAPDSYWWDDIRDRLRPPQVAAFWQVMDRVRLYEVTPLDVEGAT